MPNPSLTFTSSYNRISNVLINEVLITKAFNPTQSAIDTFSSKCKKYHAIWDTGATGTVITNKVIQKCNLHPIGIVEVHGISGRVRVNQYLINVWLPNKVIIPNIKATVAELKDIDVLIGMDIINRGDFAVTNVNNKTVFSYRYPSVERIDFVKKPYKPKPSPRIPRKRRR
jgi:predicted aspartyl protease